MSVGGSQPGEEMMVLGPGWWWKRKEMDVREIYRVKTTDPGDGLTLSKVTIRLDLLGWSWFACWLSIIMNGSFLPKVIWFEQ